jgi:hypothetical protein
MKCHDEVCELVCERMLLGGGNIREEVPSEPSGSSEVIPMRWPALAPDMIAVIRSRTTRFEAIDFALMQEAPLFREEVPWRAGVAGVADLCDSLTPRHRPAIRKSRDSAKSPNGEV